MRRYATRRFLAAFLAVLFVVTLVPSIALAALDVSVEGLTCTNSNGTWSASPRALSGRATGTPSRLGGWIKAASVTSKLTMKNTSGETAVLSFNYTKPSIAAGGYVKIDGTAVTAAGSFSKELANNGSIVVEILSGNPGEVTSSVTLNDIQLIKKKVVTTTFEPAAVGGSYTVASTAVSTTKITQTTPIEQDSTVSYTLTATAASGYDFMGWYSSRSGFFSGTTPYSINFDEAQTVTAVFKPKGTPTWEVGKEWFSDLNAAKDYAVSNNIAKIVLVSDGTLPAGNYTIPNGKTLLIPMDAAQTVYTDTPAVVYGASSSRSLFRKLTMASGAKITLQNGAKLCLPSKLSATGTGANSWNGTPTGKHGRIDMKSGSAIEVQSGGGLYCYGYIAGSGTVTAKSGSTVWECFQIRSWRGGNATSQLKDNSTVFPINQYYVQNIEAPLTLEAGATENVYTAVNALSAKHDGKATFIGSDGMFRITSGSITKRYDGTSDRLIVDVNGDANISKLLVETSYLDLDTSAFVLPITHNISINIHSGTTSIPSAQDLAFLPGAELTIGQNAAVNVASDAYVYDVSDWGPYAGTNLKMIPVGYSTVNGTTAKRTADSLVDARIDVNGTVTVTGSLYTTTGGAEIVSSEKTGKIILQKAAPANRNTQQATQSDNQATTVNIPVTPAQLKNGAADEPYTATAGAAANTTYFYCATHNKWETGGATVTFNANGGTGTMPAQTVCSGGAALNANAFTREGFHFTGWNTKADGTGTAYADGATVTLTANTTLYAQWAVNTYSIRFFDDEGNRLGQTQTVEHGQMPVAPDAAKADTAQYTYTFTGWRPVLTAATQDADYTAVYTKTTRSYTVTWLKDDGTPWNTSSVPYGDKPTHADAAKEPTAEFTYVFAGWKAADDTVYQTADLPAVTGDVTYKATFTEQRNAYAVKFVNEDGTVLQNTPVEYGQTPAYIGETPTKAMTADTVYTFSGWTPAIVPVTGEATYTAAFTSAPREYTIRFVDDDGTLLKEQKLHYQDMPTAPAVADKEDASAVYTFREWDTAIAPVTADATYTAVYTAVPKTYPVTFLDGENGAELKSVTLQYGAPITGNEPEVPHDDTYEYQVSKWINAETGEVLTAETRCTGEMTFYAETVPVKRTYTVTWYAEDGENVLAAAEGTYDALPAYPADAAVPTKDADAQYTYTLRWEEHIDTEAATVAYVAAFDPVLRSYTVTFLNEDGSPWTEKTLDYGTQPTADAPEKQPDERATYAFDGWMDTETGSVYASALPEVTGDTTYQAVFRVDQYIPYTVTWNIDGAVTEETYFYGVVPSHAAPEKTDPAGQHSYSFLGWNDGNKTYGADEPLPAVTGNVSYTAEFGSIAIFKVTFQAPDYPWEDMLTLHGETDSATVQQQPIYPSYFGYTFTGVRVESGSQSVRVAAENGVVTDEALNAVIADVLKVSGDPNVTVTAEYAQNEETYQVHVTYVVEDGPELGSYTSAAYAVGSAIQLTASETRTKDGVTYYFDHWEINGVRYDSRVITLRPNEAKVYEVKAVCTTTPPEAQSAFVTVLGAVKETVNNVPKTAVTMTWSLPDGCGLVRAGFEVSDNADHSSPRSAYTKLDTNTGTYTVHIKVPGREDQPLYVHAILVYEDADGIQHTLETDWTPYVWDHL